MTVITSEKNELIKQLRSLRMKKERRESGLHLIEGKRLVFDAINAGVQPEHILVSDKHGEFFDPLANAGLEFTVVSENVLNSVSETETPQGIIAAVKTPDMTPPSSYPKGLIVALDRIQDPGNLGTILRTADAFGAAGILLSFGCVDPYSSKALRAAMGSTYHIPVWQGEIVQELTRLKEDGYTLVCGHLAGSETLPELNEDRVLVIGSEANGASSGVSSLCNLYRLKMKGRAESLNAAVAAAILIYRLA